MHAHARAGYDHLILVTARTGYVYALGQLSTPHIFELRGGGGSGGGGGMAGGSGGSPLSGGSGAGGLGAAGARAAAAAAGGGGGLVSLILQASKYFLLVDDAGGVNVYNYEARYARAHMHTHAFACSGTHACIRTRMHAHAWILRVSSAGRRICPQQWQRRHFLLLKRHCVCCFVFAKPSACARLPACLPACLQPCVQRAVAGPAPGAAQAR
jgi:hypothetical protein